MKTIPVEGATKPAMVDDEDYPVLSRMTWHFAKTTGYVVTSMYSRQLQMNRLVLGQRANTMRLVVYKNGDRFDNQKANLELWGKSDYAKHTRRGHTCTSKFLGVFYHKAMKKWCIKPSANGKYIYTKYFDDEAEAAEAYIKVMAQHGVHYTLEDLLAKKRHVEDYEPILTGSDVLMVA